MNMLLDLRGSVGQHTQGSRDLCEITSGDECGGLVADTELHLATVW